MDFKSRMKIDAISFSSRNQSKQAQMALAPLVSILSELEYGHRVLLIVHAASVLEISSTLGSDLTCQRGTDTTTGLRHLLQVLGSFCNAGFSYQANTQLISVGFFSLKIMWTLCKRSYTVLPACESV